jgi:hypothetical protein
VAERWQTSEARTAKVFLRDSTGNPMTGLTPTAVTQHADGTAGAPAASVTEITVGGSRGFYLVTLAGAPTKDVVVRVDGGATLTTTRYVALEIPVGGYVDSVDATTSSRATAAAQTAMQTDITTLLTRLSAARALLLDNLANVDAAISTRATHAEATGDTAGTTTLLARLTATRAGLLDALSLLDVAVSTRADSAAVASVQSDTDDLQATLSPTAPDPITRRSDLTGLGGGSVTPDVRTT